MGREVGGGRGGSEEGEQEEGWWERVRRLVEYFNLHEELGVHCIIIYFHIDVRRAHAELYCAVVLDSPDLKTLFQKYSTLLKDEMVVATNLTCSCSSKMEHHPLNEKNGLTGDLELVEEFIRRGSCTCGSEMPSGRKSRFSSVNLVHAAAGFGNRTALELLVENKCSFSAKTTACGYTPLMYAVCCAAGSNPDVVRFILAQDADVNAKYQPEGVPALISAVKYRRSNIVEILLECPEINVDCQNRRQETALMLAVRYEVVDAFFMLLKAKADPDIENSRGNTALHEAIFRGIDYVEALVRHGADVNIVNKRGDTALLLTLQLMDENPILTYLLENGADPNLDDAENPLLVIASIYGYKSATEALLKYGANVNKANVQGYNALHVAAWNGKLEIVDLLLKAGIPHDLQTGDKNTALSLAAHGNFLPTVKMLLPLGCNVNNSDKDADTPIHYASFNGNEEMVEILLQYGADPNARSDLSVTPLWNAVYKKNKNLVKMLLSKNVAMEVQSKGGNQHSNSDIAVAIYSEPRSPLYVAADRNSTEIALLLVSAGYNIYAEKWLIMGEFPPGAIENETLCSLLTKFVSTPPRLLALCRNYLRKMFGTRVHDAVKMLEIPNNLKNCLAMSDLLSSDSAHLNT
ncbi:hypothetical protein FSP39_000780 [Pinctada imbricata]|uniref:SOCS box domain-containing protein n=1 Tax=Pinctada imbricata TaxID=66713 RepID=A0AA88XUX6_PINIB|nr:hypothetical protein FSP39_000780 [Pinctada imbricata]